MGECLILKSGGGIDTSNATATSDKILQGYTAYVNNVLVHGSMQYQGSVNATIQAGTYYTIPEGYHSGHGWVKAEGLTDQTSGTATADKILSKYTAWVNGVLITGNMINRGAIRKTVTAEESYTIPRGYHDGNGYVVGSPLSDQTPGDASASDLLYPRTAWVNGRRVTGSMTNRGSVNKTLSAGESYTIPDGYHDGRGIVSASGIGGQTDGTATKDKILYGYTAWVNGVKLTGSMTDRGSLTYQLPANGNYYIPSGYHNGNGYVYQSLSTQGGTTITPGISSKVACASGKYTTGTIWVAGDTNLMGENIKKGVSIFGVSGASSGYITTNIEIYNRGKNPYGLYVDESYVGYYKFYDYMIQILPYYNGEIPFHIRQSINISGYNGCVFSCASSVEHQPVKISIFDDTSGLQIGNRGVSGTGKNDVNDLYVEIQATERLPGTLTFNITLPGANSYITRILFV